MIRIRDIPLGLDSTERDLRLAAAKLLRINESGIKEIKLFRRSIDARKKNDVYFVYTVDVKADNEAEILHRLKNPKISKSEKYNYVFPKPSYIPEKRPVIVGFGPAGIFSALVLAQAGMRPVVLERGSDVDTRTKKAELFWRTGRLDTGCNVQFGEGGAGTFSDGKLNTGIKDKRLRWVLEQFAAAGAGEGILTDAKPHIGTDVLVNVVRTLREKIISMGGEVRFDTCVTGINIKDGNVQGVEFEHNGIKDEICCERMILAIGHSSRDTFEWLNSLGVPMEPKAFAMGVRIEHRQSDIDIAQYGQFAGHPALPPADYKLAVHLPNGASAYTFCMCPGGYVVAASSEEGGVVTNGMSRAGRNGENANSAVLVTLLPKDFPDKSVLGGMYWQREIEKNAFRDGGGNYNAPAQLVGDFLRGRTSTDLGKVKPTYRPGVKLGDIGKTLPKVMTDTLRAALPEFDKVLKGFAMEDAVMTCPETRSSSPVRILRNENLQSKISGLYPCGEGAGYAGGISSAAVDGIRCAEAIIKTY